MPIPRRARNTLFAALATIAVVAILFLRSHSEYLPPIYKIAPVARGDISRTVTANGKLRPWLAVDLSSEISGKVVRVNVQTNEHVKKGQVLARIDCSIYNNQLNSARADLAAALADEKLKTLSAQRARTLLSKDTITQSEYDETAALLDVARATVKVRRVAVTNGIEAIGRCNVVSPIDGFVFYKKVEESSQVSQTLSAPTLFTVTPNPTRMLIIVPINEVDVGEVQPDPRQPIRMPITFQVDALKNRTFNGLLTEIRNPYTPSDRQPQQQQQAQQNPISYFDAVVDVDNSTQVLRPDFTATVSIVTAARRNALLIPNTALQIKLSADEKAPSAANAAPLPPKPLLGKPGSVMVYRAPSGDRRAMPEPVFVQLGISDGTNTEVLSGLNAGDFVVIGEYPKEERSFNFF